MHVLLPTFSSSAAVGLLLGSFCREWRRKSWKFSDHLFLWVSPGDLKFLFVHEVERSGGGEEGRRREEGRVGGGEGEGTHV